MPLLLAQKENRKEVGPGGFKFYRKDYPNLWKEENTLFQYKWDGSRRTGISISISKVLIRGNKMDKEDHLPWTKANKKLARSVLFKPSCHKTVENELRGFLNKLEHRAEILITISHNQRTSGCYELAEAYKRQSMSSKAKAQSIRKLLMDLA